MSNTKKLFASLLAVAALAPGLAMADSYVSLAITPDGHGNGAVERTQAEANRVAVRDCKVDNPGKKCELAFTKGIARATSAKTTSMSFGVSLRSVEEAKKTALKNCSGPDCDVDLVYTEPGFYALAAGELVDGSRAMRLSYGFSNVARAGLDAVAECEKQRDLPCKLIGTGVIPGKLKR